MEQPENIIGQADRWVGTMLNIGKELKGILQLALDREVTMHKKLMMYLICLVLAAVGIMLLVLLLVGGSLAAEQQTSQVMWNQLNTVSEKLSREMEVYTGYGLQLSRDLKQDIENYLDENGLTVSDLNDRPEDLLQIQRLMYSELNTSIRLGRSSGAFAVVNATVNTQLPEAEHSRCGVYLRLINISSNVILSPETILFRGNAEIAQDNGLELHNRWNMEMDAYAMPGYRQIEGSLSKCADYYWTTRVNLKNTWENVILLMIPMYTDTGEFLGVSGIELNSVHFNLEYPAEQSPYGSMIMAAAPMEKDCLYLEQGFTGNAEGTWLNGNETLAIKEKKSYYNTYHTNKGDYYGVQTNLELPDREGRTWVTAILIPKENVDTYVMKSRLIIMGIILAVTLVMLIIAWTLSKRFVKPILQSFQDICEGLNVEGRKHSITELEELRCWVTENSFVRGELPPDMEKLFDSFAWNVKTLTNAEYHIFQYYMKGYEVAQIPAAACISMSTVKKHNGSIYRKLGISSNDELMMYLDLFRRCDRIEKLLPDEQTTETCI